MNIILYNSEDYNVINKDLTEIVDYDIRLKKGTDYITPNIILESNIDLINVNCNYAFIDVFKRFYFVNEIVPYPNNLYNLSLEVDVLESFKEDILLSESRITVSDNLGYSGSVDTDVRRYANIYESNVILNDFNSILFTTVGG